MPKTKPRRRLAVSETLDTLRDTTGRGVGAASTMLPLTQAEQAALLRVIPDQVFRIKLAQDGSVSITGDRTRILTPANTLANPDSQPGKEDQPEDPTRSLCKELAGHGKELMDGCLRTGEVQTLELQIDHNGQTTYHEVRAAACATGELLAGVRDITARKGAESSVAKSRDEVTRLNEVLRNEASLRAEDEEVLENSFTKLSNLLEDTIQAIQLIVQTKDPPTARHQARVCKLACAIGREMGLAKSQVDTIGLAALLHDLGKVFIAADTLNKPGKLTEAELSEVRGHAETEYQILKTIDLFCPIADIVHQHHERMNGSGYPVGLKGGDILLEARILGVADVAEAMVSDRPYRPALSVEAAMSEIAAGKGTLYDPIAADACIRLFRENKFEFNKVETDSPSETGPSGA